MNRLEELYQINGRLEQELQTITEKHDFMKSIIELKEIEAWERMIDDCLSLQKYNCILDTGIIAVNQATHGFTINRNGVICYERITHPNGVAYAESYIFSISKDYPYKRSNNGWSSTDSIYIDRLVKDVIKHWDTAFSNIQKNIEIELERRMKTKIENAIEKEVKLTQTLLEYGVVVK